MATPNIVPRADQEGGLGTAAKSWGKLFINQAAGQSTAAVSIENSTVAQDTLSITTANTTYSAIRVAAADLTVGTVFSATASFEAVDTIRTAGVDLHCDLDSTLSTDFYGINLNIDKDAVTASGKTQNIYGVHVDHDDAVNNVGATNSYGLAVYSTYSNAGDGDTKAVGLYTNVTGADNNYDIYMENPADATEYAYMRVGAGGLLNIVTESDDTTGHMTLQADGNVTLNPLTGNMVVKKASDSVFLLNATDRVFQIYDAAQPLNTFFRITETTNGATTIATIDGGGTNGHMTLDVDGDLELNADGGNITFKDGSADLAEITSGNFAFGNGANSSVTVDATAHDAAGKNLTLTAGATTAGTTNNIAGGSFTIQGGQGKGSGAGGDIIFQTANAGTSGSSLNALATALTISDDLSATFEGAARVNGATGVSIIDSTTSSATEGGTLVLASDDGAVMADDHRLGVIEFKGAEDTSNTLSVGARIQAICRDAWDGSNNDADLEFYCTNGTTESIVLKLDADKAATFYSSVACRSLVASSGSITGINYRTIYVDAGSMVPAETNGAQALTEQMHATNFTTMDYMAFDKATEEYADFKVVMPEQYDNGTVKVKFYWKPSDAEASVSVIWGIKAYAATDSDALTGASGVWGTAVEIEDESLNTDDDLHVSAATAAMTIAGTPAEGKLVFFRVYRKAADGTDDYDADAHLLGVNIQYRESSTASAAW